MKDMLKDYYRSLNVDEKVFEYCNSVEEKLKDRLQALRVMVIRMTEEMPLRGYMQTYFTRRMPLSGHR